MSLLQLFTNNAISLLQVSISASDTTIVLQPGQGALFPLPTNPGEFFLITLESIASPLNREIIKISGRVGDILTVHPTGRAQEGTVAQVWPAINTLVDHRITAETIRQAFLQPIAPPPSGTGGYEYSPVTIFSSTSDTVADVIYSHTHRGNKFWVSMVCEQNFKSQHFEVLTLVEGSLSANAETVTWTRTNRIGYNFLGMLTISLDTSLKQLNVGWTNAEPLVDVTVSVVRI
jgi:hypothetical protein